MGPIRYMANNHVAANILMMVLIVGGLLALRGLKVEVFPETQLDMVNVSVVYPGAGPAEVEEGIVRPIEEAVHGQDGVKRVTSSANEGIGTVMVEVLDGSDVDTVLQDVKSAVDRIITFPQEAERPVIQKVIPRRPVVSVVVYGDMRTHTLRQRGEQLRDDILGLPQITQAELTGVPPWEISIEVREDQLRRYGLTLDRVAMAVRSASLDLPGGAIKARGGEILLRTKERRYQAREYEDIVVLSRPDGAMVRLSDVATVRDTFEETDEAALFDGYPAAMVQVYRVGDQRPTDIADAVKAYLDEQRKSLPAGIKLAVWDDRSEVLQDRMNLLLKNAGLGLILVIVILGMFLQVKLAFWVTMGIPLSVLGSLMLMPTMDVSVNMISLFAFILVLGIVVDDAIVVGENVFHYRHKGHSREDASVLGAREVGRPVTFSVLTTVAAFAPLLFISGMMGKLMRNIPTIVIAVLLISLIESLFVLPAHLAAIRRPKKDGERGWLVRFHGQFGKLLRWTIDKPYAATLRLALRFRYVALAQAVVMLLLVGGLFAGKHVKFIFMPEVEGDVVRGTLAMPFGTPVKATEEQVKKMMSVAQKIVAEQDASMPEGASVLRNMYTMVGGHIPQGGPRGGAGSKGSHLAEVAVFLVQSDKRNIDSETFARKWRRQVGEIPGAETLEFTSALMSLGAAIDIQLAHNDFAVLEEAAEKVKEALRGYPGVFDVADSHQEGKRELKLTLKPEANSLGITQRQLAAQVRGAFYGAEALRLQRGRNEVKVMVRYPKDERKSLADVADMRIRTQPNAQGLSGEVPFAVAANVQEGRGFSSINRADRKRVIHITANANLKVANPGEILSQLKGGLLAQLTADYQGLTFDLEGQARERRESMASMRSGFAVAIVLIFALLAIPFRSYSQPLLIMSAIPFGIVGSVMGHMLMGYNMSLISVMGVVALTGVVVNDSLVMIDFINRNRDQGMPLSEAIMEGGKRRFRPIILTTLTTFFALVPMLAETSVQARFLVPMAISLAFGVAFATFITLVLVPVLYMILDDAKAGVAWLWGKPKTDEDTAPDVPRTDP